MNKTLLQRFLLNCNKIPPHCTCQGWIINQSPLDKQNIQVSYPPGIHVTISRICHAWAWHLAWHESVGNLEWTWASNENVHIVYIARTLGRGDHICTIDSSSPLCKHDKIIRFWVFEYQVQGLVSLRQFGRLEKSHQRVIMDIMRQVMPWSLCLVTPATVRGLLISTFHRTMALLSLAAGAQIEQGAVTGPMTRHWNTDSLYSFIH